MACLSGMRKQGHSYERPRRQFAVGRRPFADNCCYIWRTVVMILELDPITFGCKLFASAVLVWWWLPTESDSSG